MFGATSLSITTLNIMALLAEFYYGAAGIAGGLYAEKMIVRSIRQAVKLASIYSNAG
jgi:hypothetical protein